ncbi:MAG: SMP-30/gluconolactonase/LRE family protein [Clostridiales bacterium]|jgi:sugar lactone lactonase YvrE|nr:SMP-30/gluconolactonase/LRE family protein [Clostridiales bacterium]
MERVSLIVNLGCAIGEGPVYDASADRLCWIDILGGKIHAYRLADGSVASIAVNQSVGSVALRESGGFVAALQNGFCFIDEPDGALREIAAPERDKPNNRMNDGKCDSKGRFWAGTMSRDLDSGYGAYRPEGALYCLDADLTVTRKAKGVILSNGIDWSPDDKTLYYIDTPTRTVAAYAFDAETGAIGSPRIAASVPESMGMPDGMCVDAEGMLWVALWGGHAVSRWNPATGELLETIEIPALNVSSCAFGCKDYGELFVTTARVGTDVSQYPGAGGLFSVRPGVSGRPCNLFKG